MFTMFAGGSLVAAPILIGTKGMPNGSANPALMSVTANCAAGSVVAVFLESINSAAWSSITDSRSNTYTRIENLSSGGLRLAVWWAPVTTALQIGDTININHTIDSTARAINILGRLPASPVDLASVAFTGSGSSAAATVGARTSSPEMVLVWFTQNNSSAAGLVQGAGFQSVNTGGSSALAYLNTYSRGTISYSVSWTSGAQSYLGCFVSFKL